MINMGLFKLSKYHNEKNNELEKMNRELKREIIRLKKERKSLKYSSRVYFAQIESCHREIEYIKKEKQKNE